MLELFWTFFKLGLFTFGGGYAMIPQIKEIVIEKKKWLTEDEVLEMIAIAESTPGPIAINMATFIGYRQKGVLGSALATIGVVLAPLSIIFIISLFLEEFMQNQYVQYAFTGIKCAVAFLIVRAGLNMLKKMKKNAINILIVGIIITLMVLFDVFSISFSSIFFILIGGIIGIILFCITKNLQKGDETK